MDPIVLNVEDLENAIIPIGKVAENLCTQVQINCKARFDEYPTAVVMMAVTNPNGVSYPATIVRDGNIVKWDVKNSDLVAEGRGKIQLTFTVDSVVKKSDTAIIAIDDSIVTSGVTPDPLEDFVTEAEEVLEDVKEALHVFPKGGTKDQVLTKNSGTDFDASWKDPQGGSGTTDYDSLENKPQIAGVTLSGDKTLHDLGAAAESDIPDVSGFYTKPQTGIPASDIADDVIPDVSGFYTKPTSGIPASDIADGVIPVLTDLIDDTAGDGDTNKVWSADKSNSLLSAIAQLGGNTPENYGAKGDGVTDDSSAIQQAINSGYEVHFGDNKTYYVPSTITIDHDVHLIGGKNTVLKTDVQNGQLNDIFDVSGTLKKTTTLTTDYTSTGSTANSGNKFTLSDMTGINIGDMMVIAATDQYYNYSRAYYYLGGTLLIGDIYDGHLYTTCDMPWDIENTENVSVKIYNAPTVIIENLSFVGDIAGRGSYKQMVKLEYCKNSVVKNCKMTQMDGGITLKNCINTLIESVNLSKAKELNSQEHDSYGVLISSCTETLVQRMTAICGQSCVCLSGQVPNINTYVRNSELCAECRGNAVGSHENAYNTVVEDCTLTGLNVLGTAFVSRCRFIKNNRVDYDSAITFCGSHNPDWAILKVKDCVIEGNRKIYLYASSPQNPIQSFDNIIGMVEVTDCDGGYIVFDGTISETILSNRINEMNLTRWRNCKEFYRPNATDIVKKLNVVDCSFSAIYWVNDHVDAHGMALTGICDLSYSSSIPMQSKACADKDVYAEKYTMPENVKINLSATNSTTAKYIVCGNNLASRNPEDYLIGSVTGSDGGTLTRTPSTGSSAAVITNDSDGNIVYTQQNNTSGFCMYPVGMFYAKEPGTVKMSAKLKNTGATTGATFRPYIAIVDCSTGNLVSRYTGTAVQATAQGADISYTHTTNANCVAMCYYYCTTPVASSVTTFEDLLAYLESSFAPVTPESIQPYEAKRRTGDGYVLSLDGANNIMSSETNFHVSFAADYAEKPIGLLPSGSGVSF